jgi:F-type H+-transporting ATPase subunit b
MDAILHTFGVDWRLLLVQAINFGILLGGLTYLLYKPVGRMLEERRAAVAKGVEDAERAAHELKNIEGSRADMLAKAGKEADGVVANARVSAIEKEKEILTRAEHAAGTVLSDAEAQAKDTKARAIAESKEEVAKLIVLGMEKALRHDSGQALKQQ